MPLPLRALPLTLALLTAAAPLAAQEPAGSQPPAPGGTIRVTGVSSAWAMDLPAEWETFFVEVLDAHPIALPWEAKVFRPRQYYTMGVAADLDRPAAERGAMMLVREGFADGEWTEADGIAKKLQQHWSTQTNADGESYEVLGVEQVDVGTRVEADPGTPAAGPWKAWRTLRRIQAPATDEAPARTWLAVDNDIPSGGDMIGFTFLRPEAAGSMPELVAVADRYLDTVRLARDAKGGETLGGRLQEGLLWGLALGLLLIVFRTMQKSLGGSPNRPGGPGDPAAQAS